MPAPKEPKGGAIRGQRSVTKKREGEGQGCFRVKGRSKKKRMGGGGHQARGHERSAKVTASYRPTMCCSFAEWEFTGRTAKLAPRRRERTTGGERPFLCCASNPLSHS